MEENEKFREWLEKVAELYKDLMELQTFDFLADDEDNPDYDVCYLCNLDVYELIPRLNEIRLICNHDITERLEKAGIDYTLDGEYFDADCEQIFFYVDGAKFSCLRDKEEKR